MVSRPRPKITAANAAPRAAITITLTAKTRARCGVANRTGTMLRCRNSLPAARMPRMSMTTQGIAPNLSIWLVLASVPSGAAPAGHAGRADRPRARGAHAGRPGLVQRRDRRTAVPQPGDRENARGTAADQAAGPRQDPARGTCPRDPAGPPRGPPR